MISSQDLQALLIRGDQVYFGLVGAAVFFLWCGFLLYRRPAIRARLAALPQVNFDLPMIGILLLGLAVRLPLMFDSLWYDEAFTARIASVPLAQLPTAIMGDVHPFLWYSLEWVWTHLVGNSEFALRFPSLIFGLLFLLLAKRLGEDLGLSPKAARLACLILAILPAPAYYSAEARGYMLLACLAFGMVIAILEYRWTWFVACGVLICWTHNLGYVYLGVLGAFAVVRHSLQLIMLRSVPFYFRLWLHWLVLPAVIASLWLPFLFQQSKAIADGFWLEPFSPGMGLRLITDETLSRKFPDALVLPVYLVVIGFTLLALFLFGRRLWATWRGRSLLVLTIGVPLGVGVLSLLWHPVYLTRALLPCGAALAFLWAMALTESTGWARVFERVVPAALVVSLACSYIPTLGREDVRGYMAACRGVDASYATSIPAGILLSYYVNAPLLNWPEAGDLNQTLTPASKAAIGFASGDIGALSGQVCLAVMDTPNTTDAERQEVKTILDRYPHATVQAVVGDLYKATIYRLTVAPSESANANAIP